MSKILKKFFLRKKEKKKFLEKVSKTLGIKAYQTIGMKPQVEVIVTQKHRIYAIDGFPLIMESDALFSPTLFFKKILALLPVVVVDMGAVPYVCSAADIMMPGIVEVSGDFDKDDLVVILDEKNRKPIAIARSLVSSKATKRLDKGKAFRNLHYIGDEVWIAAREYQHGTKELRRN